MFSILVRVDAKKEVALGHLKRCISLASKLQKKGTYISFLTAKDDYTARLLRVSGFGHITLEADTNSIEDYRQTLELAKNIDAKIIIVDSYKIDNDYRQKLMNEGFFLVSITDSIQTNFSSDLIIDGNLNAEKINHGLSAKTLLLLGASYLILDRNFWDYRPRTDNLDQIDNILITIGGADHYDLTTIVLQVLEEFDLNFEITVIIGPYYENVDSIKLQVKRMNKKVIFINSPPSLFSYMRNCSLAFCAGGYTLYELAVLGRPTIGISLWDNQKSNIQGLSEIGAIRGISYANDDEFRKLLAEYARQLIYDQSKRKCMSRIASAKIDGNGAERVSREILRIYGN